MDKRTERLQSMVTESEAKAARKHAEKDGRTVSDWLRRIIRRATGRK